MAESIEYYELHDFANNFVSIMQDAHDMELRYEAQLDAAGEAELDARCGTDTTAVPA